MQIGPNSEFPIFRVFVFFKVLFTVGKALPFSCFDNRWNLKAFDLIDFNAIKSTILLFALNCFQSKINHTLRQLYKKNFEKIRQFLKIDQFEDRYILDCSGLYKPFRPNSS